MEPNAPKHFNQAHIFGTVSKVEHSKEKDGNKAFFVMVVLDCRNEAYGGIIAYCKIWNNAATAFTAWLKEQPKDAVIKLTGRLNQFEDEKKPGKYLNSFDCYEWEVRPDQKNMLRASTVIVGEVFLVAETDGGEHELTIMVSRPKAKDTDNMYEETFRLYVHPDDGVDISALQAATGRSVNLKGVLAQKGEYDMFEDKFSGPVRPYVKKVKVYA